MQLFNFNKASTTSGAVQNWGMVPSVRSPEMEEAVSRWQEIFLGNGPWLSHKRPRSLRLAASCSQYLSRLVCGELTVTFPENHRGSFMEEAFNREVLPQLPMAVQQALATGSVAFRPFVQNGKLKLEWLSTEQFYPVELSPKGDCTAAVFTSIASVGKNKYIRAEYQRFEEGLYKISNKAFLCDYNGKAKAPVSLTKIPAWADIEEEMCIEGLDKPLFAIWTLPFANTVDGSAEAVSLYANAEQILMDIDRLYNDYCFEFETARRKLILREDALRLKNDGSPVLPHGEHADDVYLPLDLGGDSQAFADYTPKLREEEYRSAINQLLRLFELQCGLSNGTFSFDEKGALTATEIISQDRRSYYTVREIQQQGRVALEQLCEAMTALCDLYGVGGYGDSEPVITFGDGIFEDINVEFQRRLKLVELGMKPELLLAWYFGSNEEKVKEMMKKEEKAESPED